MKVNALSLTVLCYALRLSAISLFFLIIIKPTRTVAPFFQILRVPATLPSPVFSQRKARKDQRSYRHCDVSGVLLSDVTDLTGSDGTDGFLSGSEGELLKGRRKWRLTGVHGWQGFLEAEGVTMPSDRFSSHQVTKEIVFL